MATVRHVALLTLNSGLAEWSGLPLIVGVLEKFSIQREAILRKLMAALAEL